MVDGDRIAAAFREVIRAIGEDPDRAELSATPQRIAESYAEFFRGVGKDPVAQLSETYPVDETGPDVRREPIVVRDLSFTAMCEHHFLPFAGVAHIAYVPSDRVAGLGRLADVVDTLAARPQLQERLTEQVADVIATGLDAAGVLVVLEAAHGCVRFRGPKQVNSTTVTIASRGTLTDPRARSELMSVMRQTE